MGDIPDPTSVETRLPAAQALSRRLTSWRRQIHRRPELAYEEVETAALVARALDALGIPHRTQVGLTGVVGLIEGRTLEPCILLRADMDALPILEAEDAPFRSEVDGKMHACGHDAHVACLLGAAQLLKARADTLPGSVKLVFQPAEEHGAGAMAMIRDGVLTDPPIDAAIALHVGVGCEVGQISVCEGPITAYADGMDIIVRGASAHGASPHAGVDSIVVAAHLITSLQSLISREIDPLKERILSIGSIHGGTASNILAETVTLHGTIRSYDEGVRRRIFDGVRRHAAAVTAAFGATAEVKLTEGYPPQVNDPALAGLLREVGGAMLGAQNVVTTDPPSLGGEDFSYYGREAGVPSLLYRLGIKEPGHASPPPAHSPLFRFDDERVLPVGAATLAAMAEAMLLRAA